MHSAWLRYARILISLCFFLLLLFIFIDFRTVIPPRYFSLITWMQFGPSMVAFFQSAGLATAGFLVLLLLTLLAGRVNCSTICPLGVLQDFLIRLNRLLKKRKSIYRFKKGNWWRYAILIVAIVLAISGCMVLFNLVEPYSGFGKIASVLFRPLVMLANNMAAYLLDNMGASVIDRYPIRGFDIPTLIFPIFFLCLLLLLTYKRGRLFCNLLCPVGALLGIFSKVSLLKISINKEKCNQCGLCMAKCKAECINIKLKEIDHSRCVMCFNCIGPCPDQGVNLGWSLPVENRKHTRIHNTPDPEITDSRRRFIGSVLLLGFSLKVVPQPRLDDTAFSQPTQIAEKKKTAVCPPGSIAVEQFNNRCIACHLCVSTCPTQVLQPSLLQYGLHGFMQPFMDYHVNFCNFDCTLCTEVCPTEALKLLDKESKHKIQLGKTTFIKENCVVYTFNTACGACSEHCPTKAVQMVPYKSGLKIPEVDQSICVGCGACEYACPTKPYKAIYVDGNPVHLEAKLPKQDQVEMEPQAEDFPF